MTDKEVTPTEAVIARLTVQNEELSREVYRLREQLSKVGNMLDEVKRAVKVEWSPI